ncbi:MAG: hypothetical protein U0744_15070 [Gemmataceae bacterium]
MKTRSSRSCRWRSVSASVEEAAAPIVSICGGELFIYPEIGKLTREIIKKRRHVIICTNGMFIQKQANARVQTDLAAYVQHPPRRTARNA